MTPLTGISSHKLPSGVISPTPNYSNSNCVKISKNLPLGQRVLRKSGSDGMRRWREERVDSKRVMINIILRVVIIRNVGGNAICNIVQTRKYSTIFFYIYLE